jgi:hypothetical protein
MHSSKRVKNSQLFYLVVDVALVILIESSVGLDLKRILYLYRPGNWWKYANFKACTTAGTRRAPRAHAFFEICIFLRA